MINASWHHIHLACTLSIVQKRQRVSWLMSQESSRNVIINTNEVSGEAILSWVFTCKCRTTVWWSQAYSAPLQIPNCWDRGTSCRSSAHDLSSFVVVVVVVYARSELSISDDRISRTVNKKSLANARNHASPGQIRYYNMHCEWHCNWLRYSLLASFTQIYQCALIQGAVHILLTYF